MEKLRALVVQGPVNATSSVIAGAGVLLHIFKPMLSKKSSSSSSITPSDNEEGKDNSPSFGDILVDVTGSSPLEKDQLEDVTYAINPWNFVVKCFHVVKNGRSRRTRKIRVENGPER